LATLRRRFPGEKAAPQTFVRHIEDAARLVAGAGAAVHAWIDCELT
jgi:hypothetical protein